jgi:hypothetical protein
MLWGRGDNPEGFDPKPPQPVTGQVKLHNRAAAERTGDPAEQPQ